MCYCSVNVLIFIVLQLLQQLSEEYHQNDCQDPWYQYTPFSVTRSDWRSCACLDTFFGFFFMHTSFGVLSSSVIICRNRIHGCPQTVFLATNNSIYRSFCEKHEASTLPSCTKVCCFGFRSTISWSAGIQLGSWWHKQVFVSCVCASRCSSDTRPCPLALRCGCESDTACKSENCRCIGQQILCAIFCAHVLAQAGHFASTNSPASFLMMMIVTLCRRWTKKLS